MKLLGLLLILFGCASRVFASDPWGELQQTFKPDDLQVQMPVKSTKSELNHPEPLDPWDGLQSIFLPFTEEEETAAVIDHVAQKKISAKLHKSLEFYRDLILEASQRFNVPAEVIAAVIMVESSGNPRAAAPTSSAKGLMQTIDATFAEARHDLKRQGIFIADDPFEPRASIMAGTWYLNRMFRQVERDRGPVLNRNSLTSWRLPIEYYYAGPGHGRKRNPVVMIYSGGKQIRVDKSGYSSKVLKWAWIMNKTNA